MSEKDEVVEILKRAISPPFKAVMGRGDGTVLVSGKNGWVWCRKLGKTELLMQAYNKAAPNIEDVIVYVQEARVQGLKGYEIVGVDYATSPSNIYPGVPPHAWTHEWRPGVGRDRVTVYPRAWGYLRAEPIETGSMNVWVTAGWIYYGGAYSYYRGGYSPAFSAPAGATWYQTLYLDPSDETLHITNGVTGGYGYAQVPSPPDCMIPIAAVESTGTFGAVTENMIEDVRLFMDPIAECGGLIVHDHEDDAAGGQLDHGLAHVAASLLDDDHTLYLKERASGGLGTEVPVHTHVAGQGGQLDWDDIWSDAVHSHANAGEGGQLTAANIINVPAGGIAATDVQTAINEVDAEKAGIADVETITGLWTFDRDPGAPFGVSAGSAVVTNLDADLLDGRHEAAFAALADAEVITNNWRFSGTYRLMFGPTGTHINSADLGCLDLVADTAIRLDGSTLYVDTVNNKVGIRTQTPDFPLTINSTLSNHLLCESSASTMKGRFVLVGTGFLYDVNRDTVTGVFDDVNKAHARIGLVVGNADSYIQFYTAAANNVHATERVRIDKDGNVMPGAAGTPGGNLGTAASYWNDVSYKTLTDRGCLFAADQGVEMPNGRMLSDMEALLAIEIHNDKLSAQGYPALDYTTMPKAVYRPAPIVDGEKQGDDGAELTALISIMLGALKQEHRARRELEQRLLIAEEHRRI